jgi:hypothetical protein
VTEQGSLPPRQVPPAGRRGYPDEPYGYPDGHFEPSDPEQEPVRPRRERRTRRHGHGARRRPLLWAGAAVVVIVAVVAAVLGLRGGSGPATVVPGSLITTFLPGEIQKVPSACSSVSAATLGTYLPGRRDVAAPPALDGTLDSQCNWTLDHKPTYRLLQVDVQAYSPSGLASGNGSATFAAIDAYDQALQQKQNPAKGTGAPAAHITTVPGLGQAAFTATQVYHVGGAITDIATTVIRYHNVLITVILDGLDRSNRGDYGPVSMSDLSSGALAAARDAYAKLPRH